MEAIKITVEIFDDPECRRQMLALPPKVYAWFVRQYFRDQKRNYRHMWE